MHPCEQQRNHAFRLLFKSCWSDFQDASTVTLNGISGFGLPKRGVLRPQPTRPLTSETLIGSLQALLQFGNRSPTRTSPNQRLECVLLALDDPQELIEWKGTDILEHALNQYPTHWSRLYGNCRWWPGNRLLIVGGLRDVCGRFLHDPGGSQLSEAVCDVEQRLAENARHAIRAHAGVTAESERCQKQLRVETEHAVELRDQLIDEFLAAHDPPEISGETEVRESCDETRPFRRLLTNAEQKLVRSPEASRLDDLNHGVSVNEVVR